MAVSEESRHRLYQRLEQVPGPGEATTLMEHLPPIGWADVATKRDLDLLERRFDGMEHRFDGLDRSMERFGSRLDDLRSEFRTTMLAVLSMIVVMTGAVVAAIKI